MPITQIAFVRTTLLAILTGLAALILIVGVNLWLVRQAAMYSDIVTKARAERSALVELRSLLDDAETGQRGYLLTENPNYLGPYEQALGRIPEQIDRVRAAVANDPKQQDAAAKLYPIAQEKLAEMKHTVELVNAGQRDAAIAEVKTDRGRELMDAARALFTTMLAHAETDVVNAVRDEQTSIAALQWVTIGGVLVIILVVGGSVLTVLRYTQQLVEAQNEVRGLNAGLEERVRERTSDLGRANEEIQRFAYIVTHDLRAPLVNIMGFTSELEGSLNSIQAHIKQTDEADQDPAVQSARAAALEDLPEAIGFIRSSTRKMDGLINAILKLSRDGRRVLKPEPIQLETLLKTAAGNVQHQVTEAGGEVSIEASAPPIVSDRLALEQIFGNLLDNAVKYRVPERPLHIRIRTQLERGQRILVEVEDNGRGIAKQDHDRVFDLFRRSGAQDQPGEGIGLAHVRTMVRSLGGDITLDSQVERGTTMKINLPRDLRLAMGAASYHAAS